MARRDKFIPGGAPVFPGVRRPTTDFDSVRTDLRTTPLMAVVDLSAARTLTPGSALELNIAGDSIYIDQDDDVGVARLVFQDDAFTAQPSVFKVRGGFIGRIPFTRVIVANDAQPGKVLRILYGVDMDFQAGVNASVTLTGGTVNNIPTGVAPGAVYSSTTAMGALAADPVFLAAANVNGARIHRGAFVSYAGGNQLAAFVAKATAPASLTDGIVVIGPRGPGVGGGPSCGGWLEDATIVPAGLGLYYLPLLAESINHRHLAYTLL